MTEYASSKEALDRIAPRFADEAGDWDRVLRDADARRGRRRLRVGGRRRRWVVVVALAALITLAGPTYAIGRAVKSWLDAEPAPQSVVDNFGSYTPQLGFKPEPGKAVLVASDRGIDLYATPNDRGSYCVATSTPDGGICIQPSVVVAPLIAGIMPGDPGRADARSTTLVAGRVTYPGAVAIGFADPEGAEVTRPLGAGGFFLAALTGPGAKPGASPYPCKHGDWAPTFLALNANGEVVGAATITLARRPQQRGVLCGWANGPHR